MFVIFKFNAVSPLPAIEITAAFAVVIFTGLLDASPEIYKSPASNSGGSVTPGIEGVK